VPSAINDRAKGCPESIICGSTAAGVQVTPTGDICLMDLGFPLQRPGYPTVWGADQWVDYIRCHDPATTGNSWPLLGGKGFNDRLAFDPNDSRNVSAHMSVDATFDTAGNPYVAMMYETAGGKVSAVYTVGPPSPDACPKGKAFCVCKQHCI